MSKRKKIVNIVFPPYNHGRYVLDTIKAKPIAAYSMRRLSSYYAEPAIRVRESAGNVEADMYPTAAGDFNTNAFDTFRAGADGFIVKYYDQTRNAYHMVQPTLSAQYKVVSSSDLSGKPNAQAVAGTGGYTTTGLYMLNNCVTALAVFRSTTLYCAGVFQSVAPGGDDYTFMAAFIDEGWYSWGNGLGANNGLQYTPGTINRNLVLGTLAGSQGSKKIYDRGSLFAAGGGSAVTPFQPKIGGGYGGLRGYLAEVIYFNYPISAEDIRKIQRNQMAYYGIA